jgi:hypothetical protein
MPTPFPAAPSLLCRRGDTRRAPAAGGLVQQRHHLHPLPTHRDRPVLLRRQLPHRHRVEQPVSPIAQPHPRRRLNRRHNPPPRPQLASARSPSELEAQQKRPIGGATERNLWTTRAGDARLWTTSGTPRFRNTRDSGKFHFPHILLRRGHSREQLLKQEIQPVRAALRRARGNGSVIHSARQPSPSRTSRMRGRQLVGDADRTRRAVSPRGEHRAETDAEVTIAGARGGTTGNGPRTCRIDAVDERATPSTLTDRS